MYRPISILHVVSFIVERYVNLHFKTFIEANDLLYSRQSGFRENHSCQTSLIRIIDDWITAIDNNQIVGTLMLDLSKAFDLVNHSILLTKLESYGLHISTLNWFKSYLKDRSQQTYVSGLYSNPGHVFTGVPRGSVVGPTLFLLYINDLPLSLTNSTADIFFRRFNSFCSKLQCT